MQAEGQSELLKIYEFLAIPFWKSLDFYLSCIGILVGVAGLFFSIRAFQEAQKAKDEAEKAKNAAKEAGKTVRAQTVAIELGEISQKLDKLQPNIRYADARELLIDVTRRIRRAISPFSEDVELKGTIDTLKNALDKAKESLEGVRPANNEREIEAPNAVYIGVEADFSAINNQVADLLGLFEKKNFS